MSLLALLAQTDATRVLPVGNWELTGSWSRNGDTIVATTDGSRAVQDAGADQFTLTSNMTLARNASACVVVKYVDASNYLLVEADPGDHVVRLYRVQDGVRTMIVEGPAPGVTGGATVALRVDVDGPHVTLYNLGNSRIISASAYVGGDSTRVGVMQLGDGETVFSAVTVGPLLGARINWPVFSHRQVSADIPIVPGTWEDTDINNPNIVWDAAKSRWVMYYTGYSENKPTGDDGVQMAGIAYAPTLDGPWTKEPNNPVISDLATGPWSQNGGMEFHSGRWIIAANVNAGGKNSPSMGTWFYTAAKPEGPWTKTSTILTPYVGDPYLRINQITGKLEHWAWVPGAGGRVGARWTSDDGGTTWGAPVQIVPRPPINGVNSGEQVVFVPPGKEGKEFWVTTDFFPKTLLELGRGMVMGMSPDNGATWYWHVAQTPAGSRGWDGRAAFDSTLVYDEPRKRLYLYHSGSILPDSGVLNFDIQIGHSWADWDHTVTSFVKGA